MDIIYTLAVLSQFLIGKILVKSIPRKIKKPLSQFLIGKILVKKARHMLPSVKSQFLIGKILETSVCSSGFVLCLNSL